MNSCTWLVTWTTYGSWLPGDRRGFVSPVRLSSGERILQNHYGESAVADMPGLVEYARSVMPDHALLLSLEQAGVLALQLRETAKHREWRVHSLAIMSNHLHLVVTAPGSITTAKLIGDFKAYATRQLNSKFGSRRWWTERGSGRLLTDEAAVERAISYVRHQENPLFVLSECL